MKTVFLALALALGVTAFADHTLPEGSLNRLSQDTARLDQVVRYSYLNYQVKYAVSRFAADVRQFTYCTGMFVQRDHDLVPEHCEMAMGQVHYSWYSVERYLYDTYYDFPQIYRQYVRVRNDMRALPH